MHTSIYKTILTLCFFTFLFAFNAQSQTISRFDFDSTAALTTPTVGQPALSVSSVAVAPNGIAYITTGCGHGVGLDLELTGETFNVANIIIRSRFRRGSGEGTGNFFERGGLRFFFAGGNLRATYRTHDGAGGFTNYTLTTSQSVSLTNFHEYEFSYDNCTGVAEIRMDSVLIASQDGPDNQDLYWIGAGNAFVASEVDNGCSGTEGMDWIEIGGNMVTCLEPLPVEWGAIEGLANNGTVELSWETFSETNTSHFELEHAPDGTTFESFATMPAVGNSTSLTTYQAVDTKPYSNRTFYRIKQVDLNGAFEYSKVIEVVLDAPDRTLSVGPNPTSGALNVQISGFEGIPGQIKVIDMTGQVIRSQQVDPTVSFQEAHLDLSTEKAGMYFVQVIAGSETLTKKVLLH